LTRSGGVKRLNLLCSVASDHSCPRVDSHAFVCPHRRRGCLFSLFCVGCRAAAAPDLDDSKTQKQLIDLVTPYLDAGQFVGLSIGVICDGKTKTFHFGKTGQEGSRPTDETLYEIGSVTKVFTGVLLADAVVRQAVGLDQAADDLLPKGATMPTAGEKPISLIDLSTHRSGLPRLPDNMKPAQKNNPYADYTSELALAFLKSHQLRRSPDEKMEYSNFAVSLLGHLLCRHSGKNYDELLTDRITAPLGMTDTTVTANVRALGRLATGYVTPGVTSSTWEFADMPGAGGIRSTVNDMLRFSQANLYPPDNQLGKALDLAWEQHRPANGTDFAMGLGWHLARDGQTRWHNGQTGGYHSMLLVNRRIPAAVVVLSNTATPEVDNLAQEMIQALAGLPVEPRQFEKTVDVPLSKMKRCEGRYQLAPNVVFDVTVVEDRLMVGLTGQPTFEVFPRSETEWFYKVVPASLTFKKGTGDSYVELELFQNGIRQTAKRITK
jgi:CubicO group peptidase (beta-lactamase class C family)